MSETAVAMMDNAAVLERVLLGGNLADLKPAERLLYYRAVCESVGLNPLTRPFDYITLNNKLTLYAKKDATDQLRAIHEVSITKLEPATVEGIYTVTASAQNGKGRTDASLGAVPIEGLKGEAKANAMMKAETKAKRRVTLSLCGLGVLDESEVESIPDAVVGEPPANGEAPVTAGLISEGQVRKFYAIARGQQWTDDEIKALVARKGYARVPDIRVSDYDDLLGVLKIERHG